MRTKRVTIYLEPEVHGALRLKSEATDESFSEIVNAALKHAFAVDTTDSAAFRKRRGEASIDFEGFVKALKRRRKL